MGDTTLHAGRFLTFIDRDGWEFVRRANCSAVVAIAARTPADEIILITQHRRILGATGRAVVEVPAGLVGDDGNHDLIEAARRELIEEAGYDARQLRVAGAGPSSAGLTDEIITFVVADGLTKVGEGGGLEDEEIHVHLVPLATVDDWLGQRTAEGMLIDPKVWSALWLQGRH